MDALIARAALLRARASGVRAPGAMTATAAPAPDATPAGVTGPDVAAPGVAAGGLVRSADPGPLRSFDPVEVGHLEAEAWVAYYLRQWPRMLVLSVMLVHRAFRMDWPRTLHGAWLVLRANQLWAPNPGNDPDGARRCMRRFYALLRLAHGGPDDPARAAALEVEWWAAHREHQHQPGPDGNSALVTALARLYSYLYGVAEADVRTAARLRAEAMDVSDEWVALGCPPASPLIAAERAMLVRSYASLLAAVHR
jgi:hypothetical protein